MAAFPPPEAGLVVRYDFLWPHEHLQGLRDGKDRPACVVLVIPRPGNAMDPEVLLVPITHRMPAAGALALEVPQSEKRRLGLDDERSWISLEVANREDWPKGLVPVRGRDGTFVYGTFSDPFGRRLVSVLREAARTRRLRIIQRD